MPAVQVENMIRNYADNRREHAERQRAVDILQVLTNVFFAKNNRLKSRKL